MRNIVLLHLESLNMLNYRMNPSLFPCLYHWEQRGVFCRKYYSTATSTIMVTTDLAYGGVLHEESCKGINWRLRKHVYESSFIDRLKEEGYRSMVLQYPLDVSEDTEWSNINHRFGQNTKVEEYANYNDYLYRVRRFVLEDSPFIMWLCPITSNISYNQVELDGQYNGITRWEMSYKRLDQQVKDVMSILEEADIMDNTSIIMYGDHGDDLFQHGWHGGLSHAVEPFETLIHTPLLICDDRLERGTTDVLMDTTDLSGIIERLVHVSKGRLNIADLISEKKTYVMARNLYAAQLIKAGSFEKAYSITDGKYLLLAGCKGLSCYDTQLDPVCALNLLEMFTIGDDGLQIKESLVSNMCFHFPYLYDQESLCEIAAITEKMISALREYVTALYVSGECVERLYEIEFSKIASYKGGCDGDKNASLSGELYEKYFCGKRIVLYGAGEYGRYCYSHMKERCVIEAWLDKEYERASNAYGIKVEAPELIRELEYDIVFVAIANSKVKQEVEDWLVCEGVSREKII